ncbi:MAG: hypothetical protein HYY67_00075 [Thaumarchaeota archaeon]|nr:hypothetical protein [Nitrososphaerota archaeon]
MVQESISELFARALEQIAADVVQLLPKIVITIIILTAAVITIKILNKVFRRVLNLLNLDQLFRQVTTITLPFSLSGLIILLIDLGVILITAFGIANFFLGPEQLQPMRELLAFGARIISVIVVTITVFMMFDLIIAKVEIKTGLKGYLMFILMLILTAMVIDLTALSESAKEALQQGLSIGIGISVGVFATWFFFHDYLDRRLKPATSA